MYSKQKGKNFKVFHKFEDTADKFISIYILCMYIPYYANIKRYINQIINVACRFS